MSTVLRKIEEALHPEQRQYREARAQAQANAPPGQVVLNPQSNNQGGGGAGFGPGAGAGPAGAGAGAGAGAANYGQAGGAPLAHPQAHHPHNGGIQQQDAYAAGGNAGLGTSNLPGPAPNTAGPHRHDFMNKLDPNVDETGGAGGVGGVGRDGFGHQGHGPGVGAAAGAGVAAGAGAAAMHHHDQTNPNHRHHHQEQQQQPGRFCEHCGAPRQGGAAYGAGAGTAGAAGGQGLTHGGQSSGAYEGNLPGPAPNTAGPHRSDMLNKLDPSVDSNPGGNSSGAFASGNNAGAGNNQYGANECAECGRGHDHNRHHNNHHVVGPAAAGVAGGVAADRAVEHHRNNEHNGHHGHHGHHGQGAYEQGGIANDRNNQGGGLFGRHGHHDGAGAGVGAGAGAAGAGLAAREFEDGRGNHHHHHNNNNGPAADFNGNASSANAAGIDLPGPAPNTAGPHRHDFMNKLDPSVDATGRKYEGAAVGEYAANEPGAGRGAEHGVYGQHGDMRVGNPEQTGETMTRDGNGGGRHRGGFGELSRQEAHMNRPGDNQQQGGPFASSAIQPGANQGGGAVYR